MFDPLRRRAKLKRIQQAVRTGRYHVPEEAVAEAILRRLAQSRNRDERLLPLRDIC